MRRLLFVRAAKTLLQEKRVLVVSLATLLLVVATLGPALATELVAFNGLGGRIYMQNLGGGEVCLTVAEEPDFGMIETLDLKHNAHLLVSFTYQAGALDVGEQAVLHIGLDGSYDHEWGIAGTPTSTASGTLTWSFDNVPAGIHEVTAGARIEGGDLFAQLSNCALTVTTILPSP